MVYRAGVTGAEREDPPESAGQFTGIILFTLLRIILFAGTKICRRSLVKLDADPYLDGRYLPARKEGMR